MKDVRNALSQNERLNYKLFGLNYTSIANVQERCHMKLQSLEEHFNRTSTKKSVQYSSVYVLEFSAAI